MGVGNTSIYDVGLPNGLTMTQPLQQLQQQAQAQADAARVADQARLMSTINSAYQNTLGRTAEKAGSDYWAGEVANGHLNQDNVAQAIANASKPELQNNVINNAYRTNLGRTAESAGLDYWNSQINSGALNQGNVAQAIANASKPEQTTNNQIFTNGAGSTENQQVIPSKSGETSGDLQLANSRISNMQHLMPQYQGIFNPAPSSSAKGSGTKGVAQAAAPVRNSSSMKGA